MYSIVTACKNRFSTGTGNKTIDSVAEEVVQIYIQ